MNEWADLSKNLFRILVKVAQSHVVTSFQQEMSDTGTYFQTGAGCDTIIEFILYLFTVFRSCCRSSPVYLFVVTQEKADLWSCIEKTFTPRFNASLPNARCAMKGISR